MIVTLPSRTVPPLAPPRPTAPLAGNRLNRGDLLACCLSGLGQGLLDLEYLLDRIEQQP